MTTIISASMSCSLGPANLHANARSDPMPRCIIHIGHAKTATTFLQTCMHLNEPVFADLGIWVPSDFRHLGYWECQTASQWPNFSGNLAPAFWAGFNNQPEVF